MENTNKPKILEWKDEYSVHVEEIDNQHKEMFNIVNNLISKLNSQQNESTIKEILNSIIRYKETHFATEEKYFDLFHYEGAEAHKIAHKSFAKHIEDLRSSKIDNTTTLAFELIDYLEDWLINHLMNMDHKYVKCFLENGLH